MAHLDPMAPPSTPFRFYPYPFSRENNPLLWDPFENQSRLSSPNLEKHDPLYYFEETVRKIAGVETVLFSYQAIPAGKDIIHFYTVMDRDEKPIRRQIYAAEMELMQNFPKHSYNFDFHVVARQGRPLEDIVKSPGCRKLFDRASNP